MPEKEKDKKIEKVNQDDLKDIVAMYQSYKSARTKTNTIWTRIKSFYEGTFWEVFKTKIKNYMFTPDTNYIEYTATAWVNSIYAGVYIPEVTSLDINKNENAQKLNAYIESDWLKKQIKEKFIEWGINTSLYNMQPVKVYLKKSKDGSKKDIGFENIDPFSIFLDPSVTDFKEGEAIFIVKESNIYSLLKDKRFKKEVEAYIGDDRNKIFTATEINETLDYDRFTTTGNKTVSVIEYYIKEETGIKNGFIINNEHKIFEIKNIKPDSFPIEILYNRKPTSDPYGRSLISKILNSYIVLNLLDSVDATQPYLAQNRAKFIDVTSRIDMRSFKDYGNTPDATFPMMRNPKDAVMYQDIQFYGDTTNIKNRLEMGIFNITGVDLAYKGRQTNSITTTGGVEQQQARVIMLTDNTPLVMLEVFVERLAKLQIEFATEFLTSVKLNESKTTGVKGGKYIKEQVELVFKDIKSDEFSFVLESKPYLPMTKETRFETLKQLYEMQGQYNFQIKLIQEEDLLDELPLTAITKSKLMQRISSEKQSTASLKRRETLLTFASLFNQMTQNGMPEAEAADMALQTMDEEDMMMQQNPNLGNNPSTTPPMGGTPVGF